MNNRINSDKKENKSEKEPRKRQEKSLRKGNAGKRRNSKCLRKKAKIEDSGNEWEKPENRGWFTTVIE